MYVYIATLISGASNVSHTLLLIKGRIASANTIIPFVAAKHLNVREFALKTRTRLANRVIISVHLRTHTYTRVHIYKSKILYNIRVTLSTDFSVFEFIMILSKRMSCRQTKPR